MHGSPCLWSAKDQITGRIITITLHDGKADSFHVLKDALLASNVDSTHFDQVTGTTMVGHFAGDEIKRITAEGNTRTVYFVQENWYNTQVVPRYRDGYYRGYDDRRDDRHGDYRRDERRGDDRRGDDRRGDRRGDDRGRGNEHGRGHERD